MEGLFRDAANVVSLAGTFEPVNDDNDGGILALARLPVTVREQPGFQIDLKQPCLGGRNIEAPRHKSRGNGHDVAVF